MEDAIDRETYTGKRDELRQDLALVETELDEAKNEQLDLEAIIAFAEDVLTNVVAYGSVHLSLTNSGSREHSSPRVSCSKG